MSRRQVIAASSTDDITLISKKRVTKTHSSDLPYRPSATSPKHHRGLNLPLSQVSSHLSHQPYNVLEEEKRASGQSPGVRLLLEENHINGYIPVTDIDTGSSVLVQKRGDLNSSSAGTNRHENKASSCSPMHTNGSVPPLKSIRNHTHAKSFDSTVSEPQAKGKCNSRNLELQDKADVNDLRRKFENTISMSHAVHQSTSHSHSQIRTRRRNSIENSDSGRESMILESDTVANNIINN